MEPYINKEQLVLLVSSKSTARTLLIGFMLPALFSSSEHPFKRVLLSIKENKAPKKQTNLLVVLSFLFFSFSPLKEDCPPEMWW